MYRIGQAAERSGVSVPLLRAWQRRYGIVEPARTPAGYRLYDEEAIARLTAMRQLVDAGWSPRQAAAHVSGLTIPQLRIGPVGTAPSSGADAAGPLPASEGLVAAFAAAIARVEPEAAARVLDDAYAAMGFEAATESVALPAMRAIGVAWERGELDVAAEHAASALVQRRLGAAFDAAGRVPGAPVVVVGMPAGAQHELGALAFATAARRIGLDVVYLGPNVPPASWLAAVRRSGARAVVMGAVLEADARSAGDALGRLRRAVPGLLLAIGGPRASAARPRGVLGLPDGVRAAAGSLRDALDAREGTGTPGPAGAGVSR